MRNLLDIAIDSVPGVTAPAPAALSARVPFLVRRPVPRLTRLQNRVNILYNPASTFDLKVVGGIAAFFRERGGRVELVDSTQARRGALLRSDSGSDGLIVAMEAAGVADLITGFERPIVGFGLTSRDGAVPPNCSAYVSVDDESTAQLAIEHLAERGFRELAYCDCGESAGVPWVAFRRTAFAAAARDRGLPVRFFDAPHARFGDVADAILRWLGELDLPVGIATPGDRHGALLIDACLRAGLRVPEDVGVIGCDNDELRCQMNSPALTSIDSGAERVGLMAAEIFHSLVDGESTRQEFVQVAPAGVVERRSTEAMTAEDPLVARAIQYIRGHVVTAIGVPDVLRAVGVSRSKLEARFRADLGCTIRSAIRRGHLQRARDLVRKTDMPLKQVAVESGFKTVQHLTFSFVRAFGETPARYRKAKL